MKIWFRKWRYWFEGQSITLQYEISPLIKTRVKIFVNDTLIGQSAWQFCLNYIKLTSNFVYNGQSKNIEACVNFNQTGHELLIDGLLISNLEKHPSKSQEHLPKENYFWYLTRKGAIPGFGYAFGMYLVNIHRNVGFDRVLIWFLLFSLLMGTFTYFLSLYAHEKKD